MNTENITINCLGASNTQILIDNKYPFFNGVEDRFQKALILCQTQNICLTASGIKVIKPFAEAVKEIFFNCHIYKSLLSVYIYKDKITHSEQKFKY